MRWFIAELIEQALVAGVATSTAYCNGILIRATTLDQARARALELGAAHEVAYLNEAGERIEWRFRGVRDLYPIYEPLDDGAELFYEELSIDIS